MIRVATQEMGKRKQKTKKSRVSREDGAAEWAEPCTSGSDPSIVINFGAQIVRNDTVREEAYTARREEPNIPSTHTKYIFVFCLLSIFSSKISR
jgi:hypothetical protein